MSAPPTTAVDFAHAIAAYARRLHALGGDKHHVGSPLGAWLLLAVIARGATGELRAKLTTALGMDPEAAATLAGRLFDNPPPAVAAAIAVWTRKGLAAEKLATFLASLPARTERGARMPTQAEADEWAKKNTFGLIERFPVEVDDRTDFLLANALATKVTWATPFETAAASALDEGRHWDTRVGSVLSADADDNHHIALITRTERAGDVAVHAAVANDGLIVVSVIATPDIVHDAVLAVAYDIAPRLARGEALPRLSLFDFPLGTTPMWTIEETRVVQNSDTDRPEEYSVLLPAWEARAEFDLMEGDLGFPAGAQALAYAAGLPLESAEARQSAMARYTRLGFEAAAVSALRMTLGREMPRLTVGRRAILKFRHPYAVVAVVQRDSWDRQSASVAKSPWHGVPVFSAWVAEAMEAQVDESDAASGDADPWADDEEEVKHGFGSRPTTGNAHGLIPPGPMAVIPYQASFSAKQYEIIQRGIQPQSSDDKWYVYAKDDWINFHRSWTGFCVYRVQFRKAGERHEVAQALVCDDDDTYRRSTDDYEAKTVDWLIRCLMLGEDIEHPWHPALPEQPRESTWRPKLDYWLVVAGAVRVRILKWLRLWSPARAKDTEEIVGTAYRVLDAFWTCPWCGSIPVALPWKGGHPRAACNCGAVAMATPPDGQRDAIVRLSGMLEQFAKNEGRAPDYANLESPVMERPQSVKLPGAAGEPDRVITWMRLTSTLLTEEKRDELARTLVHSRLGNEWTAHRLLDLEEPAGTYYSIRRAADGAVSGNTTHLFVDADLGEGVFLDHFSLAPFTPGEIVRDPTFVKLLDTPMDIRSPNDRDFWSKIVRATVEASGGLGYARWEPRDTEEDPVIEPDIPKMLEAVRDYYPGHERVDALQVAAATLLDLREGSLARLDPGAAYRFTWVNGSARDTNAICVRVDHRDGVASVTTRIGFGQPFGPPRVLKHNRSRLLKDQEIGAVEKLLDDSGFWSMPATTSDSGFDGSYWVVEGTRKGKQHVAARWGPNRANEAAFMQIAGQLLQLGDIPRGALYPVLEQAMQGSA